MPKCSIILTSYNRPRLLEVAINSVPSQTLADWELIVLDSSTDSEVEKILADAKQDPRIILMREPRTDSIGSLWNKGLDIAQGEYISFLDDDNAKLPQFCERMSAFLDAHGEFDAAACLSQFIDGQGKPVAGEGRTPQGVNRVSILSHNQVDSGELMVRRQAFDLVGYFDERLHTLEDWDMIIRLLYETKGIGILPEMLTQYRTHKNMRMWFTSGYNKESEELIRSKKPGAKMKISCISPPRERLTRSQMQVCRAIENALDAIPFVELKEVADFGSYTRTDLVDSDLILVLAPFMIEPPEMERLARLNVPLVTLHMEDPQAFSINAERDRLAKWVVSNDMASFERLKSGG